MRVLMLMNVAVAVVLVQTRETRHLSSAGTTSK